MKRKSVFFCYIRENIASLLILISLFLVGIVIGIFLVNHASESQKQEISLYVSSLKDNIKNSDGINKTVLLTKSLKRNIVFVLIIWIFGWTLLGNVFIYISIIYKGFSIGYTISAIIATLGVKSRKYFGYIIVVFTKFDFYTNDIYVIRQRVKTI